jgi:hypothetical protein
MNESNRIFRESFISVNRCLNDHLLQMNDARLELWTAPRFQVSSTQIFYQMPWYEPGTRPSARSLMDFRGAGLKCCRAWSILVYRCQRQWTSYRCGGFWTATHTYVCLE